MKSARHIVAFTVAAGCLLASASYAQQPQVPNLSDVVPVLEQQRNQALSNHAMAQGLVSGLLRENEALKAALADREKKIADLEKAAAAKLPQNPAE